MAETGRYSVGNQLDIQQILLEAQHRWLRPAEICEILQNYKSFRIYSEPAYLPPSGSLFLYNRKVLRYFRKDGHIWRKKKDGKTVKEAHERLKAGSIDVLHCYYAHGEENENFQRRSYWMLEEELSHIVLVHYREVKGISMKFDRIKETEEAVPYSQESEGFGPDSEMESSVSSSFRPTSYQMPSQNSETTRLNNTQTSDYEDADSEYSDLATSRYNAFLELQKPGMETTSCGHSDPFCHTLILNDCLDKLPLPALSGKGFSSLAPADKNEDSNSGGFLLSENDLINSTYGKQTMHLQPSLSAAQPDSMSLLSEERYERLGLLSADRPEIPEEWQRSEVISSHLVKTHMDQSLHLDLAYDITSESQDQLDRVDLLNFLESSQIKQNDQAMQQRPTVNHETDLKSVSESNAGFDGKTNWGIKQPLLDPFLKENLKKIDSFNKWMSKELGDVNESYVQSTSGAYWDTVENENGVDDSNVHPQVHLDAYMLSPSLSHDQLFSIIDFSPNWAFGGSKTKVLITGRFLKSQQEVEHCNWSCMFGEVEVPAEIIANGVLRCHTPTHKAGRVPFYVTCSNRLACSEVREFEYRAKYTQDVAIYDHGRTTEALNIRFGKLLCLSRSSPPKSNLSISERSHLSSKISQLLKDEKDECNQMMEVSLEEGFSLDRMQDRLVEKLLKEKLFTWLLQKAFEGGKGPNVLDDGGQGVPHFAAALGYDWALLPCIVAGINVNFRDVNGWTSLHWAAFCGRERTVATLVSLCAAPGALTDPSPKYPSGRTPADLASINGHKGIAGYLAESDLSAHLASINLDNKQVNNAAEISGPKVVKTVTERMATPVGEGDLHRLSLKDSLDAVCNATQAAARIHQVFRMQSFQRKKLDELEYTDGRLGMSDERALSLIAVKKCKQGPHDEPVRAAAIRIQNKFRSWKGRREFLITRQRIVKIQAHVRGHQVRKNYRKIVWSVGILEKVILRWRRKGSGLRGFKPEPVTESISNQDASSKEDDDDDDFLKEGRKQKEQRLQKALARVKSMVQYPEARDQYRRLLNVVTEIKESKVDQDGDIGNSIETADFDDLIDIEALLDEDTYMSI